MARGVNNRTAQALEHAVTRMSERARVPAKPTRTMTSTEQYLLRLYENPLVGNDMREAAAKKLSVGGINAESTVATRTARANRVENDRRAEAIANDRQNSDAALSRAIANQDKRT